MASKLFEPGQLLGALAPGVNPSLNPVTLLGFAMQGKGLQGLTLGQHAVAQAQERQMRAQQMLLSMRQQAMNEQFRREQFAWRQQHAEDLLAQQRQEADAMAEHRAAMLAAQQAGQGTSLQRNLEWAMSLPEDSPMRAQALDILGKPETQVTIGGKPLSPGEFEKETQTIDATKLANEIQTLVDAGAEVGTVAALRASAASTPTLSWAIDLTPEEATLASNLETLQKVLLSAMRGASVGPQEEEAFSRQLPKLGQEETLFAANLKKTQETLALLAERTRQRRASLRQGGQAEPTAMTPSTAGIEFLGFEEP